MAYICYLKGRFFGVSMNQVTYYVSDLETLIGNFILFDEDVVPMLSDDKETVIVKYKNYSLHAKNLGYYDVGINTLKEIKEKHPEYFVGFRNFDDTQRILTILKEFGRYSKNFDDTQRILTILQYGNLKNMIYLVSSDTFETMYLLISEHGSSAWGTIENAFEKYTELNIQDLVELDGVLYHEGYVTLTNIGEIILRFDEVPSLDEAREKYPELFVGF